MQLSSVFSMHMSDLSTLVSVYVMSRSVLCNLQLFGSTHNEICHLQHIQNYAARVIMRNPLSVAINSHISMFFAFQIMQITFTT